VASMATGTLVTLALIYLSPTIQMDILGLSSAWFPLKNPALVTLPLSFVSGMVVSLLAPEPEAGAAFTRLERQTHLGLEGE
jgi:cation/acetate symporter